MKGNISLGDFVNQVKDELARAQRTAKPPFYELHEVNLEVTFALEASGKGGMRLLVVDLEGGAKATQTHKVCLKILPHIEPTTQEPAETGAKPNDQEEGKGGGGGGGGGGSRFSRVLLDKMK